MAPAPAHPPLASRRCSLTRLAVAAALVSVMGAVLCAQSDPKTAILARQGWDALMAGRSQAAADAFRDAIADDPRNPQLYVGAGLAAYLQHHDSDAETALNQALSLDPTLFDARDLLGQVRYRTGDLFGAITIYQTLAAEAPDNRQVQETLERWQRESELQQRSQQAVGAHFTVSFEGPTEEALAERALDALDRAYWRVGGILATYPPENVPVVLYTDEEFRDITRSPSWAAGAYDGRIRVPVRDALDHPEEFDRVLAHEFTHALVHSLAPQGNIPTWLDEGLATALETGEVGWAEAIVRKSGGAPLAALSGGFGRLSGNQAAVAYAESALAARQLLETVGGFAVANLLRDLGDGQDFKQAFLHRIQMSFDDFQANLQLQQ